MKKIVYLFVYLILHLITTSYVKAQSGWFWQNPLSQGNTLNEIYAFDQNSAMVVGEAGTIIKTSDGGNSWVSLTGGGSDRLNSVYFIDSNTGWIVGNNGTILKTTTGGTSWLQQISGVTDPLFSVFFINLNSGWIAGEDNTILKTSNGGTNWTFQQDTLPKSVQSIYFTDENNGCAAGIDYDGNNYFGVIIKTTDGGASWTTQYSGYWLLSLYFTNSNTAWAAGAGIILNTNDGGTSWNPQITGTSYQLYSVHFSDSNFGWAVGYDGNASSGIILNTSDGGINWNPTTVGADTVLYSVQFADLNNGWAVGDNGAILKTTNGGTTFIGDEDSKLPAEFLLLQNYPNPFNPITIIKYQIPRDGLVTLKIYDVLGKEVKTLVNEYRGIGRYEVKFDASQLSSGIYFYKIDAGSYKETKKMILLK